MEYATIHNAGPVHYVHIQPLSTDVVRLMVSVSAQNYRSPWNDVAISFYADLLTSGTKNRSKEEIETYLKKYGIVLAVTASRNMVHFSMTTERTFLKKGIDLLEEIISTPAFPPHEFKLRKQTLLEENREERDNAKHIAEINFVNALYPKTSHFHKTTLDEQRTYIESVRIADFKKLHTAILEGEWYVSATCGTKEEKVLLPLIKKLARTARATPPPDSVTNQSAKTAVFTTVSGKTNVEMRIGNILPITAADDDYVPFLFGLDVLGKMSGFAGRLMSTVREKEGLTYGIYARVQFATKRTAGYWNIFTFFTAKDLAQGVESTLRELRHILTKGITEHELAVFKEITKNQFLIAHGSDAGRTSLYHTMLIRHETPEDLIHHMDTVASLTQDAVHNALTKYINIDALVIAGAGPVTKAGKGIV